MYNFGVENDFSLVPSSRLVLIMLHSIPKSKRTLSFGNFLKSGPQLGCKGNLVIIGGGGGLTYFMCQSKVW